MLAFLFKIFLLISFFIIIKKVIKRVLINTLQKGLLWTLKHENPRWKSPDKKRSHDPDSVIDLCPNCGGLDSNGHRCPS